MNNKFMFIFSLQESLNITEDFFGADFKESDFPGLHAQHSRKPHTPRRRVNISDDSSPGKKSKTARRRSHSQSSQDSEKVVGEVKEEPISPFKSKERKQSVDSQKKPKASLNITKTLSELDRKDKKPGENNKDVSMHTEDSDDDIGNKTSMVGKNSAANKKRRLKQFRRSLLESDDDLKEEETAPQVTEKPGNEVEVVDHSNNPGENTNNNVDEDSNENEASAIFIPPVASGLKKISEVTAHNKDRPPSEIFLKELKKFCRDAIRSGCVSLAELKEVLALRQKGKLIKVMYIVFFLILHF